MRDVLRVANASGFYGDRFAAVQEQLTGGDIDVLTGDYLAELTMLILWRTRAKDPAKGYATTFLRQMRDTLGEVRARDVKVVVNAGGLNPAGLADALRELAGEIGIDVRVAHVGGDDLLGRLDDLQATGHDLANIDTGAALKELANPPLTANAYLGGWGITAALQAGADVVVTGRVTDASLVTGPAAWAFDWGREDFDQLAGAVVAGHVIECGAQATGGNYAFFDEVPGLEHPGFPIAELHPDGSSVITKHPATGGLVDVGTVTAQLLYEIGGPRYLNPDVITDFRSIRLHQDGPDRVRIDGVRGEAPTTRSKVCINTLGGFRNRMTFVLTGLDIEAKAAVAERTLRAHVDLDAMDEVDVRLIRSDHADADDNAEATALLQVTVKDRDMEKVSRRAFAAPIVEMALASYPGFTMTAPPSDPEPFGVYWPTLVPKAEVHEVVVLDDGTKIDVAQTEGKADGIGQGGLDGAAVGADSDGGSVARSGASDPDRPIIRVPFGRLVGARSGDKGGNANVGVWARDDATWQWLSGYLDADRFRALVPEAADLDVDVFHLPNLRAVNVVVHGLLGEGVSSSTRPDPQAKGLGEFLRSRIIEAPADLVPPDHRPA